MEVDESVLKMILIVYIIHLPTRIYTYIHTNTLVHIKQLISDVGCSKADS